MTSYLALPTYKLNERLFGFVSKRFELNENIFYRTFYV